MSFLLFHDTIKLIFDLDNAPNLGNLYETAFATELTAHVHQLYYFDSKKVDEVDFLINDYDNSNTNAIEIESNKTQNNFRAI